VTKYSLRKASRLHAIAAVKAPIATQAPHLHSLAITHHYLTQHSDSCGLYCMYRCCISSDVYLDIRFVALAAYRLQHPSSRAMADQRNYYTSRVSNNQSIGKLITSLSIKNHPKVCDWPNSVINLPIARLLDALYTRKDHQTIRLQRRALVMKGKVALLATELRSKDKDLPLCL
jgi:hypothetical protein